MPDTTEESLRAHRRQRVLKAARVIFNKGLSSYDATLRDMSEGGVKLRLQTALPVPRVFQLLILNPNTGKPEGHICEKRWQRGDLVGARFIDNKPISDEKPEDRCPLFVPGVISGMGEASGRQSR